MVAQDVTISSIKERTELRRTKFEIRNNFRDHLQRPHPRQTDARIQFWIPRAGVLRPRSRDRARGRRNSRRAPRRDHRYRSARPKQTGSTEGTFGRRNTGADFSSASSDFKALGAFFCNFAAFSSWRLVSRSRARSAARPCTTSCGFEASETIPIPGADSIFSSRCGAISGRVRFCRQARSRRSKRLGSKDRRSARRSPPGWRYENKYRTTT